MKKNIFGMLGLLIVGIILLLIIFVILFLVSACVGGLDNFINNI